MRKIFELTFLIVVLSFSISAQDGERPFRLLDKQVKSQQGGWNGSKQELSTVFNAERTRLGDKFESALMAYLDNDVEKHYWISFFLEHPDYLHGNKPLPHLSLLIKQQGLSLLRGKTDQEDRGDAVSLGVTAAVLAEELSLQRLADSYKSDAEKLLAADSDLGGWFPALSDYSRCLYDSIGTDRKVPCKQAVANQPKVKQPVQRGVLNGLAISKPKPVYPEEAKTQRISGVVKVLVLIDEEGNVESARGVEGHPLLQEAAVQAARIARFSPLKLSGQPMKATGVLIYNFVLE